jgi:hypothetical protein
MPASLPKELVLSHKDEDNSFENLDLEQLIENLSGEAKEDSLGVGSPVGDENLIEPPENGEASPAGGTENDVAKSGNKRVPDKILLGSDSEDNSLIREDSENPEEGELKAIEDELASLEHDQTTDLQNIDPILPEDPLIQEIGDDVASIETELANQTSEDMIKFSKKSDLEQKESPGEESQDELFISPEQVPADDVEDLVFQENEDFLISKLTEDLGGGSSQDSPETIEETRKALDKTIPPPIEDFAVDGEEPVIESNVTKQPDLSIGDEITAAKKIPMTGSFYDKDSTGEEFPSKDELKPWQIGEPDMLNAQEPKTLPDVPPIKETLISPSLEEPLGKLQLLVQQALEKSLESILPDVIHRVESTLQARIVKQTESIISKQLPELVEKITSREIEKIK